MSGGASKAGSQSQSQNYIDRTQLGYLEDIWGRGQDMMRGGEGVQQLQGQAGELYGQGQQFLGGLQNNPYLQGELSAGGQAQLGAANENIATMGERAMHMMGQTGVQAGQYGQSRGMAGRGVIGEGMIQASNQASANAYNTDMARGGLFAQGQMGGLNALSGLQGIGQQGAMAPWMPAQMQAGLVGGPVTVGDSSSSASSMSMQGGK